MMPEQRAARFVAQFCDDAAIYVVNGEFVTRDEWFRQVDAYADAQHAEKDA